MMMFPVEAELLHAQRLPDMKKLTVTFLNFLNVLKRPKNLNFCVSIRYNPIHDTFRIN
jgi:hypothetical protein